MNPGKEGIWSMLNHFHLKTLIWSSFSSQDQTPTTVRSWRWVPQTGHRCIGVKRRRGHLEGNSWCPSLLLNPPTSGLPALLRERNWLRRNIQSCLPEHLQLPLKKVHSGLALGTKHSRDAMWPNNCCHILAGGAGKRRNLSANSWNLTFWESIKKTLSRIMSISIPK